jgi:hypothetical protein
MAINCNEIEQQIKFMMDMMRFLTAQGIKNMTACSCCQGISVDLPGKVALANINFREHPDCYEFKVDLEFKLDPGVYPRSVSTQFVFNKEQTTCRVDGLYDVEATDGGSYVATFNPSGEKCANGLTMVDALVSLACVIAEEEENE